MRFAKLNEIKYYLEKIKPDDLSKQQKQLLRELEFLQQKRIKELVDRLLGDTQRIKRGIKKPLVELQIEPPPTKCPACGRPW